MVSISTYINPNYSQTFNLNPPHIFPRITIQWLISSQSQLNFPLNLQNPTIKIYHFHPSFINNLTLMNFNHNSPSKPHKSLRALTLVLLKYPSQNFEWGCLIPPSSTPQPNNHLHKFYILSSITQLSVTLSAYLNPYLYCYLHLPYSIQQQQQQTFQHQHKIQRMR